MFEMLNQEYRTNYRKNHKCCPSCNSKDIEMTTKGCLGSVDSNDVWCHKCRWRGIVDNLVSEKS